MKVCNIMHISEYLITMHAYYSDNTFITVLVWNTPITFPPHPLTPHWLKTTKIPKSKTEDSGWPLSCSLPPYNAGVANLWQDWEAGNRRQSRRSGRGRDAESRVADQTEEGAWSGTQEGYKANLWRTAKKIGLHCSLFDHYSAVCWVFQLQLLLALLWKKCTDKVMEVWLRNTWKERCDILLLKGKKKSIHLKHVSSESGIEKHP